MPEVSVTDAERLVGKSRKTLYRHMSEGRVSYGTDSDGYRVLDTSELMRVYGPLRNPDGDGPAGGAESAQIDPDAATSAAEPPPQPSHDSDELARLRAEVDRLTDRLDNLIEQNSQLLRLLPAPGQESGGAERVINIGPVRRWIRRVIERL